MIWNSLGNKGISTQQHKTKIEQSHVEFNAKVNLDQNLFQIGVCISHS